MKAVFNKSSSYRINSIFFVLIGLIYQIASFSLSTTGFVINGVILLIIGFIVIYNHIIYPNPVRLFYLFLIVFSVYLISVIWFWEITFDVKDLIAIFLYFSIIPILYFFIAMQHPSFYHSFKIAMGVFLLGYSAIILYHGISSGVDWSNSRIFASTDHHKNGLAAIYEILFLFTWLSIPNRLLINKIAISAVGLLCLIIIGSKTALVFTIIFLVGYYNKTVFKVAIIIIIGIITIGYLYPFLNEDVFNTVHQRFLLWDDVFQKFDGKVLNIWVGYGPGTYFSEVREFGLYQKQSPHNYLILLFHNFGIIGLIIFLVFFYKIYKLVGIWNSPASVAFWAFNFHSLMDVGWVKGVGFFAALVLAFAVYEKYNEKKMRQMKTEVSLI